MFPTPPKASILAVGTEITTGQIVNRNAGWISERMALVGIEVVLHETVADDRAAIRAALDRCAGVSDLIFVTGGLGPTTDDFTREVIADWTGAPLEFHEDSWKKIEDRLQRFGVEVAPSNRQQAFFPQKAAVLENPQGTASGFRMNAKDKLLIVLPGPPNEISAIWERAGMEDDLRTRFPQAKKLRLFTWECLGHSEAALGELTEAALTGSGLLTGYRAHRPYVEVKVWCPEDRIDSAKPYFEKLETAIGPWVYARNDEDLARALVRTLSRGEEVEILDSATGGILGERLAAVLRDPNLQEAADSFILATEWASSVTPEDWVSRTLDQADAEVITLAISGFTEQGEWFIGLREGNTTHQERLVSPWNSPEMLDRTRRYATEASLRHWINWLHRTEN